MVANNYRLKPDVLRFVDLAVGEAFMFDSDYPEYNGRMGVCIKDSKRDYRHQSGNVGHRTHPNAKVKRVAEPATGN
jgi:hypothetical protein